MLNNVPNRIVPLGRLKHLEQMYMNLFTFSCFPFKINTFGCSFISESHYYYGQGNVEVIDVRISPGPEVIMMNHSAGLCEHSH